MSSEAAIALLRHLGAAVVLTPGILMADAVTRAAHLVKEIPGSMLGQFTNPANPEVHRRTTAVEIWEDTQRSVDVFVSAVDTGGTITGVGEVLKERKPTARIVAVEPAGAAVLSGRAPRESPHAGHRRRLHPRGAEPLDPRRDRCGDRREAVACARRLAREEGIVAGVSSGAALHAALALATSSDTAGKTIVVLLPDTGECYVTTTLFGG